MLIAGEKSGDTATLDRRSGSRAIQPAMSPILSFLAKKSLKQFLTIGGQNALDDLSPVIQQLGIGDAEFTAHSSEAEIARAEDQPFHPRGHQSAGDMTQGSRVT